MQVHPQAASGRVAHDGAVRANSKPTPAADSGAASATRQYAVAGLRLSFVVCLQAGSRACAAWSGVCVHRHLAMALRHQRAARAGERRPSCQNPRPREEPQHRAQGHRCGSNPPLQQAADLDQTAIRVAAEIDNTAPVAPVRWIAPCSMMTPAAMMWCCACCCTVAMIRHGSADPGVGTRALGSNARPAACRLIFCCPKANAGRPSPNSPAACRARAHQSRRWPAHRQR